MSVPAPLAVDGVAPTMSPRGPWLCGCPRTLKGTLLWQQGYQALAQAEESGYRSKVSADGPQDAAQTAADLHTLLDRGHIPGPYVLAGHSFGGLYVLTFAATYPDQVAGLVLLDSTAPVPGPVPPTKAGSYDLVGRISALLPAVAHLGAAHLIGDSYDSLPRNEARSTVSTAHSVGSYLDEFFVGSRSTRQAASLVDFAGKPLIVVTAGREHDAAWMAAQDKLATLSTNSRHDVVAEATHASLVLNETDAAAASQAIRDVVAAVRTSRPLA